MEHKKQQLFKKTPSSSTSSKNPIVPIQTYTGWEAGEEQEFKQSSVSAVCAVQLIQLSQQTDPKRLHWLSQNCTLSPWEEKGEIPHAQSSIHWKLLLPGGTTKLFQLSLLQEGIKPKIL